MLSYFCPTKWQRVASRALCNAVPVCCAGSQAISSNCTIIVRDVIMLSLVVFFFCLLLFPGYFFVVGGVFVFLSFNYSFNRSFVRSFMRSFVCLLFCFSSSYNAFTNYFL